MMMRNGRSRCLYYITRNFVIAFTRNSPWEYDKDSEGWQAVMSRSTPGLRRMLLAHDVPFSMPLDPELMAAELAKRAESSTDGGGSAMLLTRTIPTSRLGDTSALLFSGVWAAQCLYDFLLGWAPGGAVAQDVPRLVSRSMFQLATLQNVKVRAGKHTRQATTAGRTAVGTHETVFSITLDGIILPESIQALLATLQQLALLDPRQSQPDAEAGEAKAGESGTEAFSARFTTHPQTVYFNQLLTATAEGTNKSTAKDDGAKKRKSGKRWKKGKGRAAGGGSSGSGGASECIGLASAALHVGSASAARPSRRKRGAGAAAAAADAASFFRVTALATNAVLAKRQAKQRDAEEAGADIGVAGVEG